MGELKRRWVTNKVEVIDFSTFMNKGKEKGRYQVSPTNAKLRPLNAYSIGFNPLMLFDPTFILIGAGVFLVAILERQLASNGFVFIAAAIDSILRIAFPIVAVGAMIYLFSHSSFLL
jgi:hypothetical protein